MWNVYEKSWNYVDRKAKHTAIKNYTQPDFNTKNFIFVMTADCIIHAERIL